MIKENTDLANAHEVLIVDDEIQVGKLIANLLNKISVTTVYTSGGEEALEILKKSSKTFSLIISDQQMPGISGTEFFEKASLISPDSIRFMITGHADIHSMIDAINRGEIHKFITKPWNNDDFLASIKDSLDQYELAMENKRLFNLAKDQNSKLVELNKTLKDSAEKQAKMLEELDTKIALIALEKNKAYEDNLEEIYPIELKKVKDLLKANKIIDYEKMNMLYIDTINKLSLHFRRV